MGEEIHEQSAEGQGASAKVKAAPVDDVVEPAEGDLRPVESESQARGILEALLFSSPKSLSTRRLASLVPGWTERQIIELLGDLQSEYEERGSGLMIQEVAGGWTMATRPQWSEWVCALHRARRRSPLTPQALETLAIVAYKQPITRADVEVIRGVDAGGMLRNLLDIDLVEVVGHRETIGRPPLYGTTDHFLRTFGLRSLGDLPSVDELKSLLPLGARTTEEVGSGETEDSPGGESGALKDNDGDTGEGEKHGET